MNTWEQVRIARQWPSAAAMRRAAAALDGLAPAPYGDVLRFVADLCDGVHEPPTTDPAAPDEYGTPAMFDVAP